MAGSKEMDNDGLGPGEGHWIAGIVPEVEKAAAWLMRKKELDEQWSRDLAHDVFAACARRKEPPAHPKAYYWQAVRKAYCEHRRDQKGRTEPLLEEPLARGPSPLEQTWRNQIQGKQETILDAMPPRQAMVARLHLEGLSLAEAARELGMASSTARNHWMKAVKALEELESWLGL
jgi:RNA polymerase sigma factor (sigma-70 family)